MNSNSTTTNKIGLWSAILVVIFSVWFTIAFVPYMATLKWTDIETFSSAFTPWPYLSWVIPCLFLALLYPILMSAVYLSSNEKQRIWSLLGLIYGITYSAILTTNYWLLMTVIRGALENGYTDGLGWLVIGSPYSVTNAIEGIGYGFMGLSTLFTGLAFSGSKLKDRIRIILLFNGLAGLMGVVLGALGNISMTLVSLFLWCLTFPVGMGLVAWFFIRNTKTTK